MNRNTFVQSLSRTLPHNMMLIKPRSETKIVQIKTISSDGTDIILLDKPVTIDSPTSIRYETVISGKIWIEVEGTYVNELTLDDLVKVEVSLADYVEYGQCSFEENRMSFHKYLSLIYDIDNIKDAYVQAEIGIKALDRYDNIVYTDSIHMGLNEDSWMVHHATSGNSVRLPVKPSDVRVLVEGSFTDEFSVEEDIVYIDIPSGINVYIIYKPYYLSYGYYSKITENISINSNNEVMLLDDGCETILYAVTLKVFNTDITSTNHTPIIKSLALVATDK